MYERIYTYLQMNNLDAWIIYDYECHNPALLGLIGKRMLTRKCFIVFEQAQQAYIICHEIDKTILSDLADKKGFSIVTYQTCSQMHELLRENFSRYQNIIMEISEDGELPQVAYVDYGTICLIKKYVKSIFSSADLLQYYSALVIDESLRLQEEACQNVVDIKDLAFAFIKESINNGKLITEYDVQQFIVRKFTEYQMVTDAEPIVAVNGNAGNPHYSPTESSHSIIGPNDLVLIDLWAKIDDEKAAFGDITWMGYVGEEIPVKYQEAFDIVKEAIEVTLAFLREELPKRKVYGYEVDDVCRNYIKSKGFGDYYIHRTGHSISVGDTPHGKGVNIDNYETHDTREIIDNISFSIEPGIYTKDFGIREEIDVYIENRKVVVLTPIQKQIIVL